LTVLTPADINALAAQNASIGIEIQKRMCFVDRFLLHNILQRIGFKPDFQKSGNPLQFTILIGRTASTFQNVSGEKQPQTRPLQSPDCGCIGFDLHGFPDPDGAGGDGIVPVFKLNKTQPAGSRRIVQAFEEAQIGNIDIVVEACLKNRQTGLHGYFLVVHDQFNHGGARSSKTLLYPDRVFSFVLL
jgi:hypothetical protein